MTFFDMLKPEQMRFRTSLFLFLLNVTPLFSQNLEGVWHGNAMTPDKKDVLFLFLFEKDHDAYKATMAVPTFNVAEVKPKSTILNEGHLTIEDAGLSMKYDGIWNKTTNQIEGTYTEGGVKLILNLKKGNPEMPKNIRPQEPTTPYPYYEENVKFDNTNANVTLSGTFTRPNSNGKHPVVILISGSGRHDRDGSAMTHRPFLVLSDYLTRRGIAVLRYDDRGISESTGDFAQATTVDFAQDVLSAVSYLKSRTDIDPNQIGLIGHSEGGIIAPLVANQTQDISFIVTLAATGIPGSEVALMQSKSLRPFPVPDEIEFEENIKKSITIATSNQELESKRKELNAHNVAYLTPILKALGGTDENISTFIENETETLLKPWSTYFYTYDPAIEFEKLKTPILSLNGSKDVQVHASTNQNAIRNALIKGGNKNYKVIELKNMNHMFQECEKGSIGEYQEIEQTMSPVALNEISNWILEIIRLNNKETPLSPINNTANKKLIKSETSEMSWFMLKDSVKIEIGNIQTQIQKEKEKIYIITTVNMKQSTSTWVDSTIVETQTFKPVYHSSFNQQRDMVLKYEETITGYYLDKETDIKTQISEESSESFFDSNFYPQLIRWLPLKDGYSANFSIFDYNPRSKIGIITATVKNTEETTISFNGKAIQVWKVETTDDISNNSTINTYFIQKSTRKILKQEIDFGGRKMLMELVE